MVRAAFALLLAVPSAFAAGPAPVVPSLPFEGAVEAFRADVNAARAARAKAAAADIGPHLNSLAWDLDRAHQDVTTMRRVLAWLAARARAYRPPTRTRPESDPQLRWDLRTASRNLETLARNAEHSLQRLHMLAGQATKDEALVLPAQRLAGSASTLSAETGWLGMDSRTATSDIRWAGFSFEAMDIDNAARELEDAARSLDGAASALRAKVGG